MPELPDIFVLATAWIMPPFQAPKHKFSALGKAGKKTNIRKSMIPPG